MKTENRKLRDIMIVTEEEAVNSLFVSGGTKVGGKYLVIDTPKRKNAKDIYFTFNGNKHCINKKNKCILDYRELENKKKWFTFTNKFSFLTYGEQKELEQMIIAFEVINK